MVSSSYNRKTAQNYAQALFDIALERKILQDMTHAFSLIRTHIEENKSFKKLIQNPIITPEDQERVLFHWTPKSTHDLFAFIIKKKKLPLLENIAHAFLEIIAQRDASMTVCVEAAHPLTPQQRETLKANLKNFSKTRPLKIVQTITPHLLGGIRLKFDEKVLDLSLMNQMHHITQENHV